MKVIEIMTFLIPYLIPFVLGFALAWFVRSGKIDRLSADLIKVRAEQNGTVIRTSADDPVRPAVRPVQAGTARRRTQKPLYGPGHAADHTAPLPTAVQYVPADGDQPMTDAEYRAFVVGRQGETEREDA